MTLSSPQGETLMTALAPVLLVVDDERPVLNLVERFARKQGFDVVACAGGRAALDELRQLRADMALVDVRMPDVNGLEILSAIREHAPACKVVLMTGHADIDAAIQAIKLGALDFLGKPLDFQRLGRLMADVRDDAERRRRLLALEGDLAERLDFHGMVGRSPVMEELFSLIRRLAPHLRTGLITGETGVGKELAARALHARGPRAARRIVTVNCSAIVPTLFESELFGHVRGAFTGATDQKVGVFEYAHGGTLFFDEVGELPLPVQAKLLRALETGEVQRVGAVEGRRVDVLVLAATNRDLRAEVDAGRFRSDLYYRLNVIELLVPPLRERREDIPYLVATFVREFSRRIGRRIEGITPGAERLLMAAAWPGNVRELRNVIERASMLAEGDVLTERALAGPFGAAMTSAAPVPPALAAAEVPPARPPDTVPSRSLDEVERDHVVRVLDETNGNKQVAAARLGVSRRALYRLLERHALDRYVQRRSGPGSPPSETVKTVEPCVQC